jgi:hypothetical protein
LIAAQKKQNTRRSLAESVHKIYAAGMFVTAGFIVGFDTEKGSMAKGMIDCIEDTGIPMSMVGPLTALPNTQLTRRLEAERRLLSFEVGGGGDQCTSGLNFITLRPRRDILQDYKTVLEAVYEPTAYFKRVRLVGRTLNRPDHAGRFDLATTLHDLGFLMRLLWRMTVTRPELRRPFWRTVTDVARHNPAALEYVIIMITFYLHLGTFASFLNKDLDRKIALEEKDPRTASIPAPAAVASFR